MFKSLQVLNIYLFKMSFLLRAISYMGFIRLLLETHEVNIASVFLYTCVFLAHITCGLFW